MDAHRTSYRDSDRVNGIMGEFIAGPFAAAQAHRMHRPNRKHTTYYRCRLAFGANINSQTHVHQTFLNECACNDNLCACSRLRIHHFCCAQPVQLTMDVGVHGEPTDNMLRCAEMSNTDIHRFDRLLIMNIDSSLRFVVVQVRLSSAKTQDDGEEEEVNHVWQHCEHRGNELWFGWPKNCLPKKNICAWV